MAKQEQDRGARAAAPMLWRAKELQRCTIGAMDGDIGTVHDLHFDDQSWTVRVFVVDTGAWLSRRRVVISPAAIRRADATALRLISDLTTEQVRHSPDVDTSRPVSRQQEVALYGYYGWPYYWMGPYRWGPVLSPSSGPEAPLEPSAWEQPYVWASGIRQPGDDPHLRSARGVRGYRIQATDGLFGHIEDLLVEDRTWAIRYLVIDTGHWWPGKHVLVSTEWITDVSWGDEHVGVDVTKDTVRKAPEYDPTRAVERQFEARLHGHYERPAYWDRPPRSWMLFPPAA
jgi:hypothetical protein